MKQTKRTKQPFSIADEWVGTPFHHQASIKGVGCDCAGLIKGVGVEYGMTVHGIPDDYGVDPDPKIMIATLEKNLVRCDSIELADVLLFTLSVHPQHLAITNGSRMIHAYRPMGKVVHHILDDIWKRRVHSSYRFPVL